MSQDQVIRDLSDKVSEIIAREYKQAAELAMMTAEDTPLAKLMTAVSMAVGLMPVLIELFGAPVRLLSATLTGSVAPSQNMVAGI